MQTKKQTGNKFSRRDAARLSEKTHNLFTIVNSNIFGWYTLSKNSYYYFLRFLIEFMPVTWQKKKKKLQPKSCAMLVKNSKTGKHDNIRGGKKHLNFGFDTGTTLAGLDRPSTAGALATGAVILSKSDPSTTVFLVVLSIDGLDKQAFSSASNNMESQGDITDWM